MSPAASNSDPMTAALIATALRGDHDNLRELIAAGADINGRDKFGDPVLVAVLSEFSAQPAPHRYDTVRELLRLGADPRLLGDERAGPLCSPMWDMDTDMLRLLLDAGALPNHEAGHLPSESFYDLAVFDYGHEVWSMGNWPEEPSAADRADPDAWLRFLDSMAVKHGRRRPDHLQLLRDRGGKTAEELHAAGQWPAGT